MIALEDEFEAGELEYTFTKDPGTSGNFEIKLTPSGELIHSKKTRGQGRCETQEERAGIYHPSFIFL